VIEAEEERMGGGKVEKAEKWESGKVGRAEKRESGKAEGRRAEGDSLRAGNAHDENVVEVNHPDEEGGIPKVSAEPARENT